MEFSSHHFLETVLHAPTKVRHFEHLALGFELRFGAVLDWSGVESSPNDSV